MKWPLAYFITWTTYGSWLPGDEKGSFDALGNFVPPNPRIRQAARQIMVGEPIVLSPQQRAIVDKVLIDHCNHRGWLLHARNVRTQHVHVVVSAAREGEDVREQFKAWCSRRLSEAAGLGRGPKADGAFKWWTEKGNVLEINSDKALAAVNTYVAEDQ
jgi:REP element-mobilizing transposase RayT